jgi:lipase
MEAAVLVHGLFQGLGHLRDVAFPGSTPVLVLDLLGYGQYRDIAAPLTIDAQVEHVVAQLDRNDVSRATLVGHSVGGAVAMLAAARHTNRVAAIVNIEGNFTLADAFWSSKVAAMAADEVEMMLADFRSDSVKWLTSQKIASTPPCIARTQQMFAAQPASSVHALAKAIVQLTERPEYLNSIDGVPSAMPVHLFAGERSRGGWAIPESFVRRAATFTTQPNVGHMMPLEDPDGFLRLLATVVQ